MIFSIVLILFLIIGSVSALDSNNSCDDTTLLNNDVSYSQNLEVYGDSISDIISYEDGEVYSSDGMGENDTLVKQSVLSGNDTVLYYKNGTEFKVVLSDSEGSPLVNQSVIFTFNNVNYTRTTNDNGVASIAINLESGTYAISSFYAGNENYASVSSMNTVEVFSTISGEDIGKYFKNDTQYYATFVDGNGNLLNDTMVTFNINGVFYQRKTNENGTAKLNINLSPGEYILTATSPINGEMHSNKITVLTTMLASDIVKYYKNDTQYQVKVLNNEGNPLINQEVTFNIHGVFYNRTTNGKGIAKMNINLSPGEYIITATNPVNGEMHSNNINVLPTIFANDLTMLYRDGSKFTAKLLDDTGNPLANTNVTFNINGIFYNRITDSEGKANLNINLDSGKYIITATDCKGAAISKIINIGKCNSTIKAEDAHVISGIDRDYSVTLLGSNNKTIPSSTIKFKYNGATVTSLTDGNGEATMHISNPSEGKYSIEYEFEGNINYYPCKSSSTIIVANSTSILTGNNLKMFYQDGSKFNVTLTNSHSLPIANETITFNICGKSYNRITDEHGVAGLNINLIPGTYEISYSYSQADSVDYNWGSNTIVVSKLNAYLSTNDLTFVYGNAKAFTAVLTDSSKNPLKGIDVTFNICGKSYTRTTNDSGVAKLNINLPVGYYNITTSIDNKIYTASSKSNHVLVDGSIFVAYDITVYPGLTRDFSVTLLDAYENPILNADIEFTFNGIKKHAITDDEGMATISVGGLSEGDYLIVYKYAERNNVGQSHIFVSKNVLNTKNTISNLDLYLSDSQNCQVSNPEIVALAKQLTRGLTNPLDKARAIYNYVRDTIRYGYYYDTYYGALGTLHSKTGNCVDQAHLSIALYRAVGLPARYVHGTCEFRDGDTYGHVWSQVLVGNTWIVSDPINSRNSLGTVVNWNNYNYKLHGYFPYIVF